MNRRATGCQPRRSRLGDGQFKVYDETRVPLLRREELENCSLRPFVWHVIDQGQQSSCCPSACAGAFMLLRKVSGLADVVLSQGSLYGQITSSDNGAPIDGALDALRDTGICPADFIPPQAWHPSRWPSNWQQTAGKYRALEWWDCPSAMHIASAIARGMPVVMGVKWTGGGGHAIVGIGLQVHNRQLQFDILNSWGMDWGEHGCGYLPESQVERGSQIYGAFALRSITIPDPVVAPAG